MDRFKLPVVDSECYLIEHFFTLGDANHFFEKIKTNGQWQQQTIKIFGREVETPRLSAWYGDDGAVYRYSGVENQPLPWFSELLEIKFKLSEFTEQAFNSVLLNLYRDGRDSMGWHADDEPELGSQPFIASVSFGQARRFMMKHKTTKQLPSVNLTLTHGSLLIMAGNTQRYWKHSLPKSTKPMTQRINLTYRMII